MHGAQTRIVLAIGWDIEKLRGGSGEIGKTEHEPSREDRAEQYNSSHTNSFILPPPYPPLFLASNLLVYPSVTNVRARFYNV